MDQDGPEDVVLGEIVIRYQVPSESQEVIVNITLPDQDDIPVVIQLGMLELARDSILHPEDDG